MKLGKCQYIVMYKDNICQNLFFSSKMCVHKSLHFSEYASDDVYIN